MRNATVTVLVFVASAMLAQDGTRQLWNAEFLEKRPAGAAGTSQGATKITYKPAAALKPVAKGATQTMVGITLWRLREPKTAESGTRLLVLEKPGAQTREQVPERIDSSTILSIGDQVRLT